MSDLIRFIHSVSSVTKDLPAHTYSSKRKACETQ